MRRRRRLLATLTLVAAAFGLGVAQASSASAHAQILSSTPSDGSSVATAPRTVTLVMSEAVELRYTRITITDGEGRQSTLTGLRIGEPSGTAAEPAGTSGSAGSAGAAGGSEEETPVAITADLPPLAPDLYRLAWTTVSSDDLHVTNGVVVFGVRTAVPVRAVTPPDPIPGAAEVTSRWLALVGMGAAAGAALLSLLLSRYARGLSEVNLLSAVALVRRRLMGAAIVGATVCGVAEAARLLDQAHATGSGWWAPAVHLLDGGYGARWAGREIAAVAVVLVALSARRTASGRSGRAAVGIVVAAAGYALSVTLTGHAGAAAAQHPVRVALETAHITAALAWLGALVVGALVLWRPVPGAVARWNLGRSTLALLRRQVLRRFGLIAATCLAVMTTTGLLLVGSSVQSVDALLLSTYGRLLLLKLALVAVALSAAATTALVVHPDLVPRPALRLMSTLRLRVVLGIEAVAAVLVILAAAALGSAQPAVGPTWAAPAKVQPLVSGTAGDLVETVQVAPNRPGRNFVTVDVFDSRRPVPAPIGSVEVTLTAPDGTQTREVATNQGAGRWLLPTDAMSTSGRWAVDLSVARPGLPISVQRYGWVVSDPSRRGHPTVVSNRSLEPGLSWAAAGVAGFALVAGGLLLAQTRGSRRRTSAPPSGASPTQASPLNVEDTAATSASPSPVPGSSPAGWR
jgi:copper transport protein